MRRKVTLNLDERFVAHLDELRGDVPRSRWIERGFRPVEQLQREAERSPKPPVDSEVPREPSAAQVEPRERSYSELPMRERFAILKAEKDAGRVDS